METNLIFAAVILGTALVVAVLLYVAGKVKIEQQKTLRKLLERGESTHELIKALSTGGSVKIDTRRGVLFVALGLSWSASTVFIGGAGWIFGLLPFSVGLAFLLLGKLNERKS